MNICERCDLNKTSKAGEKHYVKLGGVGNPNADIFLVGLAPGYNEIVKEIPFIGRAGQLLRKCLRSRMLKKYRRFYIIYDVSWKKWLKDVIGNR